MQKTCVVCGKDFETESHSRITCSEACLKIRWKVAPKVVKCIFCGAPFTRKWHGSRQNVCSEECRVLQRQRLKRQSNARLKEFQNPQFRQPQTRTVKCLRCGEPFESKSRENRICPPCQNINELLDARTYAPIYEIAISASKARRASA